MKTAAETESISLPKAARSDPAILISNAAEYETMMGLAYGHEVYPQVLHNGHIAVELSLKALYARESGGTHPFGHDLGKIVERPLKTGPLFEEIKSAGLKQTFELISSAWHMQYRYHGRPTDQVDARNHLGAYKEALTWIRTRFEK